MCHQLVNTPEIAPLLSWQGLHFLPGLNAVTGDEGSGKTRLLRELCDSVTDAVWLDLRLPGHDDQTPQDVWRMLQARCPAWNPGLQADLAQALHLQDHLGKQLFMLSAGSRRKVALAGLLASGARIVCIDQPYAALDLASVRVVREFLSDMADGSDRAWVVADYEADAALPWRSQISMDPRTAPDRPHTN